MSCVLIRFAKSHGIPTLTCIRADGSSTYQKSKHGSFFGPHDLLHYAVESTLIRRDSFFGLIAQGRAIAWFAEPGAAAMLPAEALHTEHMVGILQQELAFNTPRSAAEFNEAFAASVAQSNKPGRPQLPLPPALTEENLAAIRDRFARVLGEYNAMGPDGQIELQFGES